MDKGILDPWNLFRDSLGEDGRVGKPEMIAHIWEYVQVLLRLVRKDILFQPLQQLAVAAVVQMIPAQVQDHEIVAVMPAGRPLPVCRQIPGRVQILPR